MKGMVVLIPIMGLYPIVNLILETKDRVGDMLVPKEVLASPRDGGFTKCLLNCLHSRTLLKYAV